MIIGIGIDVVELERMAQIIEKQPKFSERTLTAKELTIYQGLSTKRKVEFLAGRFACKEAFSKAYGTGIGKLTLHDIEVLPDEKGKPVVTKSPFTGNVHVSISHSESVAVAQIILEESEI